MRWDDLYVAGLGMYIPEQVQLAQEAVDAGLYDAEESKANGIRAVHVAAEGEAAVDMAAAAGRRAVVRSGHGPHDFDLVLHAYVGHQGQELWSPANYVQNEAVGGTGMAIEVKQGSNGGLAALELAASHLAARPGPAALITTGDAFKLPYFDRWSSDSQQAYGDGAGALVLSSQRGFAQLLSTASYSDSSLEPIYRGGPGWTDAPFHDQRPIDLRTRKRDYLLRHEDAYDQVIQQMTKNVTVVLQQALDDAGTELAKASFFVHANIAETIAEFSFYTMLGVDRSTTTYDWGQDYGHMGAGDQLIGLNHLFETGRPKPGDIIVTLGVGTGFMWTVAVLKVLDSPQFS